MQNLLIALKERIDQIHTDKWGKRGAPELRLDDVNLISETQELTGTIDVLVPARNGSLVHYKTYSLSGIDSLDKLDDLLADILSKVLAEHTKWPR